MVEALSSSSSTGQRNKVVECDDHVVLCDCAFKASLLTAWKETNPRKRFYIRPKYHVIRCFYFKVVCFLLLKID